MQRPFQVIRRALLSGRKKEEDWVYEMMSGVVRIGRGPYNDPKVSSTPHLFLILRGHNFLYMSRGWVTIVEEGIPQT